MLTAQPYVYLIEASLGFIKIGQSVDPAKRVRTINTYTPCPVRLIAEWPGSYEEEQELHRRFVLQRRHNEWFEIAGDLALFVEAKRGVGLRRVPGWSELNFEGVSDRRAAGRRAAAIKLKALWAETDHRHDVKRWREARLTSAKQAEAA